MLVDLVWRVSATTRLGFHEFRAEFPWRLDLVTYVPRSVLQCLFFTGVAVSLGGTEAGDFAIIGSVVLGTFLYTVAMSGDVPMRDRWNSTFYRTRTGCVPVFVTYALRVVPLLARVVVANAASIVVAGLVFGKIDLMVYMLLCMPIYLLIGLTSLMFGLAIAAIGLFGRRGNDVIFSNLGLYLLMICSGCVFNVSELGIFSAIGRFLPSFHGLSAIRTDGSDILWWNIGMELAVGALWLGLAAIVYTLATVRIRRTDSDKVT